ncbi:AMP-binding protein [Nocardia testacea]|uniref:AMP-binding protein n=1 Tax=Nocardia testacea TaxID=248551 RepID=UPI0033FA8FA9
MSFLSPYPAVDIPNVTLYESIFGNLTAEERGATAFLDGSSSGDVTYAELAQRIDALAGALTARGLEPGQVAAIVAPNSVEFAVCFHAVLHSGGTVTTVNALYITSDIARQLADSGATWVFTVSSLLSRTRQAAAAVGIDDSHVILLDLEASGHDTVTDLIALNCDAPGIEIDPATTVAVLPYSSGTTGQPKGVMLTHRNLVANLCQLESIMGVNAADRVLAVLPFFHIYGLNVLLNLTLRRRAALLTMPKFDLLDFLQLASHFRITCLYIAPPIAVALAKDDRVDGYDLSSVRTVISGAAPLDNDLGRAVARRLDCSVRQGFGMSELSPVSHVIPHDRPDISLSTVGIAVPNLEFKVADPVSGEEIPVPDRGVSAPGELWCRGPNIMAGYLNNPTATAQTIDADGYLHTGDLVTVDAGGIVTVVDRLKELIKYKGYQVPPAELEALLLTHPFIVDAAVVGVPDDDGEEIPKAFVVLRHGAQVTETEVVEYVADKVAPYKKVRTVAFVDAIPKSAAGKILRRILRTEPPLPATAGLSNKGVSAAFHR